MVYILGISSSRVGYLTGMFNGCHFSKVRGEIRVILFKDRIILDV